MMEQKHQAWIVLQWLAGRTQIEIARELGYPRELRRAYKTHQIQNRGNLIMSDMPINIYELHEKMTADLFPAYSNTDERFLALALCGEAGELANLIKKRWRDGADLTEEVRDEIADIRIYLELIARCFGIEAGALDARVEQKLAKVVEKHKARIAKA